MRLNGLLGLPGDQGSLWIKVQGVQVEQIEKIYGKLLEEGVRQVEGRREW